MAIFRKIHLTFWSDPFISELKPDEKLFYIYLLTNPNTTQCGIYEITKRQMSFETGFGIERIDKFIEMLSRSGKVKYNEVSKEIAIKNWNKYNSSTSPKVKTLLNKELNKVKDTLLIEYLYSMDTEPNWDREEPEQEEEPEENKNKNAIPSFEDVLNYMKSIPEYKIEQTFSLRAKYDTWVENKWRDNFNKPIKEWKLKFRNQLPYLKKVYNDADKPIEEYKGNIYPSTIIQWEKEEAEGTLTPDKQLALDNTRKRNLENAKYL